MGYFYRLRCRINEEGFANTARYIFYTGLYCIANFTRDTVLDYKYSGRSLRGNHTSTYKHLGANDTYHTDYSVMPLIFKNIEICPDDVLVDVGCGKGRIINYWLSRKLKNEIVGLELDPKIACRTARQFSGRRNIRIIPGDAISNLPSDGTVFYFYNPFTEEKVREFEDRVAKISENKAVKVIYYNPKSLHVFYNGNWTIKLINFEKDMGIKRWGRMNKFHDLAIITRSNSVAESIWEEQSTEERPLDMLPTLTEA
jgi:hypothetical protein